MPYLHNLGVAIGRANLATKGDNLPSAVLLIVGHGYVVIESQHIGNAFRHDNYEVVYQTIPAHA